MADLRMYVPSSNHRAVPETTTGFQTNYPVHNCLDFNLDSSAKANTTSVTFTIDTDSQFGSYNAVSYTWVGIFIKNYEEMNVTPFLQMVLESSTDSAFTSPTALGTKTLDGGSTMLPWVIWEFSSSTDRYFRIVCTLSTKLQDTSMVYWGNYHDVDYRHQWGGRESERAFNTIDVMGAGRELVRNYRSMSGVNTESMTRTYSYISDTSLGGFKSAFRACRGRWLPMIIRDEAGNDSTVQLVKWAQDELVWTPLQNDLNDVSVTWDAVPYSLDSRIW